eukprot:75854-Pleurochrysis_carterae.AAC.2
MQSRHILVGKLCAGTCRLHNTIRLRIYALHLRVACIPREDSRSPDVWACIMSNLCTVARTGVIWAYLYMDMDTIPDADSHNGIRFDGLDSQNFCHSASV